MTSDCALLSTLAGEPPPTESPSRYATVKGN